MSAQPIRAVPVDEPADDAERPCAEELFGLAFAYDAVLAVRADGEITIASPRAAALVGVAVDALAGRQLADVVVADGGDPLARPCGMVSVRASGRRLALEVERVPGDDMPVFVRLAPVASDAARRALVERHDALVAEQARRRESIDAAQAVARADRERARATIRAAGTARIDRDRTMRGDVAARLEDPVAVIASELARLGRAATDAQATAADSDALARGLALVARVAAEVAAIRPRREEDDRAASE